MTQPHPHEMMLAKIHSGQRVIDADGAEIGTVSEVKFGDPDAVTAEGQTMRSGVALADAVTDTFMAGLPPGLLRTGYLKVSPKGLLHRSFYVSADDVETVDGDTVRLAPGAGRTEPDWPRSS